MSGILSGLEAAGQLFAGYGFVTLGPVKLYDFAAPQVVPIGGDHTLDIHKLPGGAKIINAMGPDDAAIGWHGTLTEADASVVARTFDKIRRSGTPVQLAWDVFSYTVIVREFSCDTRFVPPMDYRIVCEVVEDSTYVAGITPVSMALQVSQDLMTGNPIGALSAVSSGIVGTSVATAASAAATPGGTTLGTAAYNGAVSAVNTAAGAIDSATTAANNALAPLGTSIGALSVTVPAALDTLGFAGSITNASSSCGDLANLSMASGFVGRAQANMQGASA